MAQSRNCNEEMKKKLADTINEFGFDLFGLFDKKDNDIFYSPASINLALAMVRLGAKNQTLAQLTKGMHLDRLQEQNEANSHKEEEIMEAYKGLVESDLNTSEFLDRILRTANRMYLQKSFEIKPAFSEAINNIFKITTGIVDFVSNPVGAANEINGWVEEYTNHKIKEIVKPDMFNSNTKMAIVNAVYLNAFWDQQFEEEMTKQMDFRVNSSTNVKVDMMQQKNKHGFLHTPDLECKVLHLKYNASNQSMMFILPDEIDGLNKLVPRLNPGNIRELLQGLHTGNVTVKIPKFKMEENYQLQDLLPKLGITDVFSPGGADLSGITGCRDLYVSRIVHKAVIDLNEKGTEASAATALIIQWERKTIYPPMPDEEFVADHPFIFLILDGSTGVVIFMGCLRNPVRNPPSSFAADHIVINKSTHFLIDTNDRWQ